MISEPAAAILAYGLGQTSPDCCTCLVYRCGGTSLSVSVARVTSGFVSILGTVHKTIGGEALTKVLADFLAGEFQRKHRVDPRESKRSKQKLMSSAETVKHVLSTLDTANCYIESLFEGIDFNTNVTRARFENSMVMVSLRNISCP